MITVSMTADFSEVDGVMRRLSRAINERTVHSLASKVAERRVKATYLTKFKKGNDLYPSDSWQKFKKSVGLEPIPGVLTGTTRDSITSAADDSSGRIFLKGNWPKGSGSHKSDSGSVLEWNPSGLTVTDTTSVAGWGAVYNTIKQTAKNLATKQYGEWRKSGSIDWLYLDDDDVGAIEDVVQKSLEWAVQSGPRLSVIKRATDKEISASGGEDIVAAELEGRQKLYAGGEGQLVQTEVDLPETYTLEFRPSELAVSAENEIKKNFGINISEDIKKWLRENSGKI